MSTKRIPSVTNSVLPWYLFVSVKNCLSKVFELQIWNTRQWPVTNAAKFKFFDLLADFEKDDFPRFFSRYAKIAHNYSAHGHICKFAMLTIRSIFNDFIIYKYVNLTHFSSILLVVESVLRFSKMYLKCVKNCYE